MVLKPRPCTCRDAVWSCKPGAEGDGKQSEEQQGAPNNCDRLIHRG